jgi:hypothetical protein
VIAAFTRRKGVERMAESAASADALLESLSEATAAADAALHRTVEEEAARMDATRQQAVEHGVDPKAGGEHGWVGSMRRKFERFLEKHSAKVGYDKEIGVQAESGGFEVVRGFMDYCFNGDMAASICSRAWGGRALRTSTSRCT